MTKRNIPPFENDRIILRLLEEQDLPLSLQWRNVASVRKWFINTDIIQEEKHAAWFDEYKNLDNDFVFIILAKDLGNRPVGQISLYNINWEVGTAAYGRLMIGDPMARGKGYAKQATVALLNLAFNMLHMNELILKVKDDNKSALAIYESIGFTRIKSSNNLITMIARRCASKTGR